MCVLLIAARKRHARRGTRVLCSMPDRLHKNLTPVGLHPLVRPHGGSPLALGSAADTVAMNHVLVNTTLVTAGVRVLHQVEPSRPGRY